jgi:tRNA (cmo5U34)-methyltransferase
MLQKSETRAGPGGFPMSIDKAFDQTTDYYDSWIRKAVPGYDDMFGIASELLSFPQEARLRVLDLGAGTGLFSRLVLEKYPNATFVLWDVAEKMLELARDRFRSRATQFRYVTGDYRELPEDETFDLVISSLSIHHLADPEKKELFGRIYRVLDRGGTFINIDQIRGPSENLQQLYCRMWEEKVRQAGASEEEIQGGIERRRLYDREATLSDQLEWLSSAGFDESDCIYKNYLMGLFLAVKG